MSDDSGSEPVDAVAGGDADEFEAEHERLLADARSLDDRRGFWGWLCADGWVLVLCWGAVAAWVMLILRLVLAAAGVDVSPLLDLLDALPFSLLGGAW